MKEDNKARYMQLKIQHQLGEMKRVQLKTVKKSVKNGQMGVDTGNQIILKQVQESHSSLLNSVQRVMDGSTKNLMKMIHQEHSLSDKNFQ